MNNTEKMARLLGRIRKEMNGAVTEAMEERGIKYPLNYGVSIPTLRDIAREWAPDHPLARLLYVQQVRELRLAALTIADPGAVTAGELDFWGRGVENTEVAEHLAMTLLANTNLTRTVMDMWLTCDEPLLAYAALMTAARSGDFTLDDTLRGRLLRCLDSDAACVRQGVVRLLERAAQKEESLAGIRTLADSLRGSQKPSHRFVADEIEWIFDSGYEA